MRDCLSRFFRGRYGSYGTDNLTRFLLVVTGLFFLISVCTPLDILYYLAFIVLIYCYFRLLSKNISARYHENKVFTDFTKKILSPFRKK